MSQILSWINNYTFTWLKLINYLGPHQLSLLPITFLLLIQFTVMCTCLLLGGLRSSKQIHHRQLPCNFEVCSFYFRSEEEPSSLSPLYPFIAAFRHPISLNLCRNQIVDSKYNSTVVLGATCSPEFLLQFRCSVDLKENLEKTNFC